MRTLLVTIVFATGIAMTPLAASADSASMNHPSIIQASQADEFSAAKRKRARVYRGSSAYGSGNQIACNRFGCRPIPRGCQIVPERSWSGTPTGQDAVICPRY
jgi:hypothetical protein